MTVIYNAKSHVSVIFSLHGSVLPSVLPWCIYNSLVSAVVWMLAKRHVVDLSFHGGGPGYTFLSVLVSFFTVTNVGTTYNRFWEARGHLGSALNAAALIAHRAAVYTRNESHEKAQAWRAALKKLLTQMLRNTVYTIEEERAALANVYFSNEKEQRSKGAGRRQSILTSGIRELDEKDPLLLAFQVDDVIASHHDYGLDCCINPNREQDLLRMTADFTKAFHNLLKFSTTPRPFPSVQMGRTIILAWVLSLPFVIVASDNLPWSIFLVFFITYGFIGLLYAEIEIHDPLGKDPNGKFDFIC